MSKNQNFEVKISVGGAIPPEEYQYWLKIDEPLTNLSLFEDLILTHSSKPTIISVGRDSYKYVFEILKRNNIDNIKVGIHSKTSTEDVQPILDLIAQNGWEEHIDEDKSFNGRYIRFTEEAKE